MPPKLPECSKRPGGQKQKAVEEANVEVLTPFWKNDEPGNTVCPLIVYADLIATGNPRNLETADIIYEQFVGQYLRKAG